MSEAFRQLVNYLSKVRAFAGSWSRLPYKGDRKSTDAKRGPRGSIVQRDDSQKENIFKVHVHSTSRHFDHENSTHSLIRPKDKLFHRGCIFHTQREIINSATPPTHTRTHTQHARVSPLRKIISPPVVHGAGCAQIRFNKPRNDTEPKPGAGGPTARPPM